MGGHEGPPTVNSPRRRHTDIGTVTCSVESRGPSLTLRMTWTPYQPNTVILSVSEEPLLLLIVMFSTENDRHVFARFTRPPSAGKLRWCQSPFFASAHAPRGPENRDCHLLAVPAFRQVAPVQSIHSPAARVLPESDALRCNSSWSTFQQKYGRDFIAASFWKSRPESVQYPRLWHR